MLVFVMGTIMKTSKKSEINIPKAVSKLDVKHFNKEKTDNEEIVYGIVDENNKCFVISPIGKEGEENYEKFKDVLEYIIKPAIEDSGYDLEVLRADEINKTGSLIKDILKNIYNSFIVIADLTGQNPNVFYELGVRHSLKPRTILIAQSIDDIPFDLRDYRLIEYDTTAKGASIFREKLNRYLKVIFENPNESDNPVLDRLGNIKDQRIIELEKENRELNNFKLQDIELREKIKAISNPKQETNNKEEFVGTRLGRILILENTYKIYQTKDLPYGKGNFELHRKNNGNTFLYISSGEIMYGGINKSNFQNELAEIRVMMEECSKGQNIDISFILVTNTDLSSNKELIQKKFNKMKNFLNEKSKDLFTLEIWDNSILKDKEKELGIKI